jgi:hypothetical protein
MLLKIVGLFDFKNIKIKFFLSLVVCKTNCVYCSDESDKFAIII